MRSQTAGPEVGMNVSPTGWARKRGMIFTSHHDAPVASPNSMRVIDATVKRRAPGSGRIVGPQHRVDVITGLKAMTIWPAYQIFEEETKGCLEVGKLADFVILSKDPTAVAPTTIADIQVTETIKEDATVFRLAPAGGKTASDRTSESFATVLHPSGRHHVAGRCDGAWRLRGSPFGRPMRPNGPETRANARARQADGDDEGTNL